MKSLDKIDIDNEEIKSALERPPGFLIRSGTFLILTCFSALFLLSLIIKYPISINAYLNIEDQIYAIKAPQKGYITDVGFSKRIVSKNDILAYYNDKSEYKDIIELEKILQKFVFSNADVYIPNQIFSFIPNIGILQKTYMSFLDNLIYYKIHTNSSIECRLNLIQSYSKLLLEIKNWKENNLVISPINGILVYRSFQNEIMNVSDNDTLFLIKTPIENILNCKIIASNSSKGEITARDSFKIFFPNRHLESIPVQIKVKSINQNLNQDDCILSVEAYNINDVVYRNIVNIKNERIPIIISDSKSIFSFISSKIREMVIKK